MSFDPERRSTDTFFRIVKQTAVTIDSAQQFSIPVSFHFYSKSTSEKVEKRISPSDFAGLATDERAQSCSCNEVILEVGIQEQKNEVQSRGSFSAGFVACR